MDQAHQSGRIVSGLVRATVRAWQAVPVKPTPNTSLEGSVRDIASSGDGVVQTERGIVMVRGALPGERVRIALGRRSRGVLHGELLAILEESPEREPSPACELLARCGGCALMPLALEAQRRHKLDRLAHATGLARDAIELVPSKLALGYRTRARLAFERKRGSLRLGYREPSSHALVDVAECVVLDPALGEGLRAVRGELSALEGSGELSLSLGARGRAVAFIETDAAQPAALYAQLATLAQGPALAGVGLQVSGIAAVTHGDVRQCSTAIDGEPLWGPPGGFAQASQSLNLALVARAIEWLEPVGASVLELYAGHGNFTVGLGAARSVLAIESDPAACAALRQSLQERRLAVRISVRCEDVAIALSSKPGGTPPRVDAVLLDPPRTGAREALPGIVARKPRSVVYVSCNAATLSRDLAELARAGYDADAAAAFDMFPHTPHLEAVVRLRPRSRAGAHG